MCFSATASFSAAIGLGAMGVATMREAKTRQRLPLAAMPFLFGLQQAVEGVVWVSSSGMPALHSAAAFVYVMFSHVLWPFYVPLAIGALEPSGRRKTVLRVFLIIGIALSLWLLTYVLRGPVTASCGTGSIIYSMVLPPVPYGLAVYVLVTCISCLISSHKFVRVLGLALVGGLAISFWAYTAAFYSVWCFFSALLSAIIFVHLRYGEGLSGLARHYRQEVRQRLRRN